MATKAKFSVGQIVGVRGLAETFKLIDEPDFQIRSSTKRKEWLYFNPRAGMFQWESQLRPLTPTEARGRKRERSKP